jgi:hypothetical protein
MPRNMTQAFLGAMQGAVLRPALFVQAAFVSGPIYVWSGIGQITWNGQVWTGIGTLGSISTIEEGSTVAAKGITLTLSGIDASLLNDVMTEFQVGLPVSVTLGVFDTNNALIADPVCCFSGRMDQPTIDVTGTLATIAINCENRLVEMNVAVDRRYTDEDQQMDYPGDLGFQFVNGIQEAQIYWGRSPSSQNNL